MVNVGQTRHSHISYPMGTRREGMPDILLFSNVKVSKISLIGYLLDAREEAGRQNASKNKSRIIFSKNLPIEKQGEVADRLRITNIVECVNYSGAQVRTLWILATNLRRRTQVIILTGKISGWRAPPTLSQARRIALLKFVCSNLPN